MVLEAVVYPQDPFSYGAKDPYNFNYNYYQEQHHASSSLDFLENQTQNNWDCSPPSILLPHLNQVHQYAISSSNPCSASASASAETNNACSSNNSIPASEGHHLETSIAMTAARPKRRRAKTRKNKEEIENQRMTHIAVERNRRKQMNEYLSVLRSLMPESYVQRGDQASIIGGAINFVKELEQRLQFLGAQGKWKSEKNGGGSLPFSEFFTFPQYSSNCRTPKLGEGEGEREGEGVSEVECGSGIADIEVTMVESHANLKIRSKKRPKQLLKMVSALHTMRLTILHLNVTTTADIVLYSLSVKVEEDCKLGSVDDIAAALFQLMDTIHQEAMLLN